jgi:hypothetical protein
MSYVFDVNGWLKHTSKDDSSFDQFVINYINEITKPTDKIKRGLANIVSSAWIDPDLLTNISNEIGWTETRDFLLEVPPSNKTAKRGEFGEALTYELLEKMLGFRVPVRKLRYKVTRGQSLPGTDILALKLDGDSISEVCFIECKLRTILDYQAALDAYTQLLRIRTQKYPDIVKFTASRLKESRDKLYGSFLAYMLKHKNPVQIESFRITLIYDQSAWDKKVIERLGVYSENNHLGNTYVDVISIEELKDLVDSVYGSIGIEEVIDD